MVRPHRESSTDQDRHGGNDERDRDHVATRRTPADVQHLLCRRIRRWIDELDGHGGSLTASTAVQPGFAADQQPFSVVPTAASRS
jgi:hypothetical protein